MMFNLRIENITKFSAIPNYGYIWLVEFYNYTKVLVIADKQDSPDMNYILWEMELND